MADNTHGFINEEKIRNSLNNKKSNDLNDSLKEFIVFLYPNIKPNDNIVCKKVAGQNKEDCTIIINGNKKNISIKMGSGNSVHQESVSDFCDFLNVNFKTRKEVLDNILFFIWGDLTLNGTGKVSDRLSATKIKKNYPNKIALIQKEFNSIKKELIERFLFKGNISSTKIDCILYKTRKDNFLWATTNEIWNYFNKIKKKPLSIYSLTFQAWNRNINGGDKSEKKRGVIQLKWGSLEKDLLNIKEGR